MAADKITDRTVVSLFYAIGKKTGRELAALTVIMQAFATDALTGTGVIATVAAGEILLLIGTVFHPALPSYLRPALQGKGGIHPATFS